MTAENPVIGRLRSPIAVRPMRWKDTEAAGRILTRAFNEVFDRHGYPAPFAQDRDAIDLARWYFKTEPAGSFVITIRDQVAGTAFRHRRGRHASIGPVAVDPSFQSLGLGRSIMEYLLHDTARCDTVRLFQDAFNTESFALYTKLGFQVADLVPIVMMSAGSEGGTTGGRGRGGRNRGTGNRERGIENGERGIEEGNWRTGNREPGTENGNRGTGNREPGIVSGERGIENGERGRARVQEVGSESLEEILTLDARWTGAERRRDLQYLLEAGRGFLLDEGGTAEGFLLAYPSRGGVYVGPAVAPDQDRLHLLLEGARKLYQDGSMIFRLPGRHNCLLRRLLAEGYRLANLGTLMVRGKWKAPACAELLAVFPESL